MKLSRILVAGIAAAILAGSTGMVLAQNYPAAQQPYPQQNQPYPQQNVGAESGRFLTPEERKMWREEHRGETQSMTADQRRAYFQQLRQQYQAMSVTDKANVRNALQARWNALPPQKQQAFEQRIAQKEQGRQGGEPSGAHGNAPAGGPQSRPDDQDDGPGGEQ